ncbi:MAG TPA: hypothetical protein ENK05_12515 [Gammaproteobacteria bacterium]|nr:hypothetical protein [Gammaproteobacteria bacterium]
MNAGLLRLLLALWLSLLAAGAQAHHVIGRPSYNLNEDSNTPPSIQMETQIGDYSVTYMVFPAFPRPGEPARINLYASRLSDGQPYQGKVRFSIRDSSWFGGNEETIGTQTVDYNVFRQNFIVKREGDYVITARFEADGQPYIIDFPLRIGDPAPIGTIGVIVAVALALLFGLNLIHSRRRLANLRIRDAHEEERGA